MDPDVLNERLSRLSTAWTLVFGAHDESTDTRLAAQKQLLERYQGAIYRYLLGAVRKPDEADELFQEFAVQFLRGGFRHADPQRGRFRDYVRTSLVHLIRKHRRPHKGQAALDVEKLEPAAAISEGESEDDEFNSNWRQGMLAKAWASLAESGRETGQPFYAVLKFRTQHRDATASEMAAQLNQQLRPERAFTDTGVRKTLQRARERFADLLIDEVAQSLENPTLDQIEQELIDLRLLAYCRPVLHRRRGR